MGKYVVRFKGAKVKGVKKGSPMDDEEEPMDDEEEEAPEPTGKGKKPFQPEKKVVANMLGFKKAKKEDDEDLETGEKGSSKSGNYGHAGIPGKVGGSAPKAKGAVAGGAAAAPSTSVPKLSGTWTAKDVESSLNTTNRQLAGLNSLNISAQDRAQRRAELELRKAQLEDKKAELSKPAPDQAKADYIKAHPESVAAHQAADKPLTAPTQFLKPFGGAATHTDAAKGFLDNERKKDLGKPFLPYEVEQLTKAGFQKVDGHNAYVRKAESTPFAESASVVQAYRSGPSGFDRSFVATHLNKDEKHGWLDSSEHGYADNSLTSARYSSSTGWMPGQGIDKLIAQVDKYQGKKK